MLSILEFRVIAVVTLTRAARMGILNEVMDRKSACGCSGYEHESGQAQSRRGLR